MARYHLLRSQADGLFLAECPTRGLHLTARGEDVAMWRCGADDDASPVGTCSRFTAAVAGSSITAQALPSAPGALETGYRLELDEQTGLPCVYDAVAGPVQLPSVHLAELRESGLTVVAGFSAETCAVLRAAVLDATLHTVADLGSPSTVTDDATDDQPLQLSVPRARRGSTGGEGIQVLRAGEVVQGAPDTGGQSVTIPFDSISSVNVNEPPPATPAGAAAACVTVRQGEDSAPFAFGVSDDVDAAQSLAALIRHVAFDEEQRADGSSGRSKGFWDGEQGHLFGRMHCHPVMLWLLEEMFAAPARTGGHTPNAKVIMPQDGSWGPGQGWHSDTPCECPEHTGRISVQHPLR